MLLKETVMVSPNLQALAAKPLTPSLQAEDCSIYTVLLKETAMVGPRPQTLNEFMVARSTPKRKPEGYGSCLHCSTRQYSSDDETVIMNVTANISFPGSSLSQAHSSQRLPETGNGPWMAWL